MKKFIFKLFLIILFAAFGFSAYKSIKFVPKGQILVAFDNSEKRVIASQGNGVLFMPYALLPSRISFFTIESRGAVEIECSLSIPELKLLDDPLYSVSATFLLEYEIDSSSFVPAGDPLEDPMQKVGALLKADLITEFTSAIAPYLEGSLDGEKLKNSWPKLLAEIRRGCKRRGTDRSIKIIELDLLSILKIPDSEVYNYGLLLRADLLELRRKHAVERESVQHALNLKAIETGTYYKHLEMISNIIVKNPQILKYIYIDKLGSNVKLVVPINKDGYAFGLDNIQDRKNDVKKSEDIDNLK